MLDANTPDDAVRARLRSVLPVHDPPWYAGPEPPAASSGDALISSLLSPLASPEPAISDPTFPERPSSGRTVFDPAVFDPAVFDPDLPVPAISEQVFSAAADRVPDYRAAEFREPGFRAAEFREPGFREAQTPGATDGGALVDHDGGGPDGGVLAGRLTALGAFDPGRRGVKALAAVAVVATVVVALVAWRSRPQAEPVSGMPVSEAQASDGAASSGGGSGDPAGTVAVGTGSAATGATARSGAGPGAATIRGSSTEIVVAVGGKVHRPGLVHLAPGARVADALQAAGGADRGVDVAPLNLARKVVDGELIMVGVVPPPGATGTPHGPAGPATGGKVNLNTATVADLDTLPGVGPVLAQRIIDRRDQQSGFTAVSDLRKVEGIGAARFEQLKDLVTV